MPPPLKLMISAGEASGDLHAAHALQALKQQHPAINAFGLGGPALRAEGMNCQLDCNAVSVIGITEALLRYRSLKQALNQLIKLLEQERPALLLTVDFPDFNLKLARAARARGIPVLHYISPKVWAWRPKRIDQIAKSVDHIALIFPFEQALYQAVNLDATYVGNPLKDQVRRDTDKAAFCQRYQLDPDQALLALVPGSRSSEIKRLLPLMIRSAERLQRQKPQLQFVLPLAPTVSAEQVRQRLPASLPITLIENDTHRTMSHADALLIASGTATLEAAIIGTPMCVIYKIGAVSHFLVKRLIQIPFVSLVNIVAGKAVVKELLQDEAQPDTMASEMLRLLDDQAYRAKMKSELQAVNEQLGEAGAATRLAELVLKLIDQHPSQPPPAH